MPATFTMQGELSRDGLEAARDQLDELLRALTHDPAPNGAGPLMDRKVRALYGRMGQTTWEFVHGCAEKFEPGSEFTFENLAQRFGQDVGTVKSWHRSASKSINRINEQFGGAPVFESRWDGSRQHYRVPAETREAILALGKIHEEN